MKIGVILPSRGLIFSRTAEEILLNLRGYKYKIFFAHKRPIPECFNEPLELALADESITHIWFVEDDMVLPSDTLNKLVDMDKAVVTADYPVNKDGRGSIFTVNKRIVFCGTGCLFVDKQVFSELKKPYFRTDVRWNMKNFGDFIKMTSYKVDAEGYGLHDINFCMALYKLNIPIHSIKPKLAQRKLLSLGKAGSNNGAHNIEVWKKIEKDHLLKMIKSWPAEKTGKLISVETEYGMMNVTESHAKKLIDKGLAKPVPRAAIVIDWTEYEAASVPNNI